MDQLTAYRILHLMPGSTRKEIRQAYARLAKEYHPEEHPKEFNQIQEAYQLLTGRGTEKTGRQMRGMTGFRRERRRNLTGNRKNNGNLIRRTSDTLQRGNFSDLDCRNPVLAVIFWSSHDSI